MKHLVLMCGLPAAGKSTIVDGYVKDGYNKLSRDDKGRDLAFLNQFLKDRIKQGNDKIILDNTYTTRASRAEAIKIGKDAGYKVTVVHLTTKMEDALYNSVSRMIKKHGRLLKSDSDYKDAKDVNAYPPAPIYVANKQFEKPEYFEGFDEIITVPFKRKPNGYTNKAVILDYDGTLRVSKSGNKYPVTPEDVEIIPGRVEKLKELKKQGYILLGVSNQSGVAKGDLTYETAVKCFEITNALLGVKIDYRFCPHRVPPITCYCRKPGPGLGVELIEEFKLDPAQTIMVGDMTTDETFAKRCGFKYSPANKFFA